MHDVGSGGSFDDETAFVATVVILVGLLLVAMLFFGSVFVSPLS